MSPHAPDVTVNNSSHCEVLTADLITSCNGHLPSTAPPLVTQHKGRAGLLLVSVKLRALGRAAGQQSGLSRVKCWQVLSLVDGHRQAHRQTDGRTDREGETAALPAKAADCAVHS